MRDNWELVEAFYGPGFNEEGERQEEEHPMYEELELCEFLDCCASGAITDDDGIADVIYDSGEVETNHPSAIVALPPDTKRMIKVIHWYNR